MKLSMKTKLTKREPRVGDLCTVRAMYPHHRPFVTVASVAEGPNGYPELTVTDDEGTSWHWDEHTSPLVLVAQHAVTLAEREALRRCKTWDGVTLQEPL